MPTPVKKEKWRVMLAVQPSLFMGYTQKNDRYMIGYADMLYKFLDYIFTNELRESGVIYDGVELLLWKGKGNLNYYPSESITVPIHDIMLGFAQQYIPVKEQPNKKRFNAERAKFIKDNVSPLCTGRALTFALDKLKNDGSNTKTLLFVMSDDPDVFSAESIKELNISYIPDLTVFFLREDAVAEGCPVISRFNQEKHEAVVYEIASWNNDLVKALQSYNLPSGRVTNDDFSKILNNLISTKRGVCYGIYGVIKDAVGINHSHRKSM